MEEQAENPTPSGGDSIQERLESYLSPDEPKKPQQEAEAQKETPQAEAAPATTECGAGRGGVAGDRTRAGAQPARSTQRSGRAHPAGRR